ncbi:MAG TPA: hypothetical protein VI861_03060 [Rickettsiales bacterium]|nr:hypothetical protein [Rickettsiales bacterium]
MSAVLNRNKIIIVLSFFLTSCALFGAGYIPKKTSAQIDCPTNPNIVIVEKTNREEVLEAAKNAWIKKQQERTNEGYTVLRLPDGRSTAILNVAPEKFSQCAVITLPPVSTF